MSIILIKSTLTWTRVGKVNDVNYFPAARTVSRSQSSPHGLEALALTGGSSSLPGRRARPRHVSEPTGHVRARVVVVTYLQEPSPRLAKGERIVKNILSGNTQGGYKVEKAGDW